MEFAPPDPRLPSGGLPLSTWSRISRHAISIGVIVFYDPRELALGVRLFPKARPISSFQSRSAPLVRSLSIHLTWMPCGEKSSHYPPLRLRNSSWPERVTSQSFPNRCLRRPKHHDT